MIILYIRLYIYFRFLRLFEILLERLLKENKLGALALQAVKEQQTQIEDYELQLESQNQIINSLVEIVCEETPDREICLEN